MIGVYRIVNVLNGKTYVGSSKDIEYRLYQHRYELRKGSHENAHLQNAFAKYGEENFRFEVVSLCMLGEELYHEQNLINKLKPIIYNINYNVTRPPSQKGKKQSTEHISKRTESYRKAGHKMSTERKIQMSKLHKDKCVTNEWKMVKIAQINPLTGECIQVFDSLMLAGRSINTGKPKTAAANISRCLLGFNESAFGQHWLYWDKITPPFHGQSKEVKEIKK